MISAEYRSIVVDKFPERAPEIINRQIDEVVKFLSIISSHQGRFIPLTQDADEVWHEMIVQTRHYMEFCNALPGSRYIHHESIGMEEYADKIGKNAAIAQFLSWVPDYLQTYGPFTSETAEDWAVVQFLVHEMNMELADVNSLGRSSSDKSQPPVV